METTTSIGTIDKAYVLEKEIGKGGTSTVYLARKKNENYKKTYAIKLLNSDISVEDQERLLSAEFVVFQKLQALEEEKQFNIEKIHKRIIQIYMVSKGEFVDSKGKQSQVNYIVMENASKGEFLDYINVDTKKGFTEKESRFIFKQILKSVYCFHLADLCHRDLKSENFMVDDNFQIKLCDFGFSSKISSKQQLSTPCGTHYYKAPELWGSNLAYDGIKVDIFALGIILFTINFGFLPFNSAQNRHINYRKLRQKQYSEFWKNIFSNSMCSLKTISNEFKDLFQKMTMHDSCNRPDIKEILNHPWFSLDTASSDEIKCELQNRYFLNISKNKD